MAYEVRWADTAVSSLVDALDYIGRESAIYAASFAIEAERAAASLDVFPERGRRVAEFRDPAVRELPVSSYRMIYRVASTYVIVLALCSQGQRSVTTIDGQSSINERDNRGLTCR